MVQRSVGERLGPDVWEACAKDDPSLILSMLANKKFCAASIWWIDVLAAAICHGSVKLAARCLQEGAVVNDTVLMHLWDKPESEPIYRHLVEKNAVDIDHYIDRTGSVLGIASYCSQHSLAQFCLEKGARPDEYQAFLARRSNLACAAVCSDAKMLGILLDGGATLTGSGALMEAASFGKLDCVRYLIARGADVNEQNFRRHRGKETWRTGKLAPTPLAKMTVTAVDDIQGMLKIHIALRLAVEKGHLPVVQELLQAGADVLATDEAGRSVLDIKEEDSAVLEALTASLPKDR